MPVSGAAEQEDRDGHRSSEMWVRGWVMVTINPNRLSVWYKKMRRRRRWLESLPDSLIGSLQLHDSGP